MASSSAAVLTSSHTSTRSMCSSSRSSSRLPAPVGAVRPASVLGVRRRGASVVVRADGDGGKKRVDWDREWNSFMNSNRQQQDSTASSRRSNVYTTTGNSQRRRSVPVDPAAKMTRDAIKREEAFLLNAWSSDKFQGAGVALAVLVLLVLLLAAGPPPADTRCTLPWC